MSALGNNHWFFSVLILACQDTDPDINNFITSAIVNLSKSSDHQKFHSSLCDLQSLTHSASLCIRLSRYNFLGVLERLFSNLIIDS